jgi:hypothetical protein
MKKIEIYDPAMCCSTGVCGPSPDQDLVAFASELKGLADLARIERFNLAQQSAAFAANPIVQQILADEGPDVLPAILVDGKLAMKGVYPSKAQLTQLIGVPATSESGCGEETEEACCSEPEAEEKSESSACCEGDSCC